MRLLFLSVFGIAHTSIGLLLNPYGFCVAQISQAISALVKWLFSCLDWLAAPLSMV